MSAHEYEDVAASQTDQTIGDGGTGAGQHLSHIIFFPASTSPGAVTLKDGGSGKTIFPGGTNSVSNLVPFTVYLGINSKNGAFSITTGANVSVRAVGDFN
jgi:hypothetical protein